MNYERTGSIERAAGATPGQISGILATDGEASDGHILNIDGGEIPSNPPLLFGHDDFSGSRNLGSWSTFEVFKHGDHRAIRGKAQIELGGKGEQQAWRADVAHMIDQGHIGNLSIRWEPTDHPIKRTSLPTDHPAAVDSKTAEGRREFGLFFPHWKMLEGSVVTLGADPEAMIGRFMHASEPTVRSFWRTAINDSLVESHGPSAVVALPVEGGDVIYVERRAFDSMLELANQRLNHALDILEEVVEDRRETTNPADTRASRPSDEQGKQEPSESLPDVTPRLIYAVLGERLAKARIEETAARQKAFSRRRGKIT